MFSLRERQAMALLTLAVARYDARLSDMAKAVVLAVYESGDKPLGDKVVATLAGRVP